MSEDDGFVREVTEDVQRDRMAALVRKYAPVVGGCVLAIIVAVSGYAYWTYTQTQQAELFGEALLTIEKIEDSKARTAAYADLAKQHDGKSRAALAYLQTDNLNVTTLDADNILYKDAAVLANMYKGIDTISTQDAVAALEPLTQDGRPFRLAALELMASVYVRDNNTDKTAGIYKEIATNPATPPGMRSRAMYMLQIYPDVTIISDETASDETKIEDLQ